MIQIGLTGLFEAGFGRSEESCAAGADDVCQRTSINVSMLSVYILFILGFFCVFYPLQFPSQSNAAAHTDQYCTCPHPNVLSVFIIDLLKCLYLYPLCVLVLIFQKSLIFSAPGVQETLLYAVLLSHRSKTRFQTEQQI